MKPTPPRPPAELPVSIGRLEANAAYWASTERLANACVAKHKADAEHAAAMQQYEAARAAAVTQGLVPP